MAEFDNNATDNIDTANIESTVATLMENKQYHQLSMILRKQRPQDLAILLENQTDTDMIRIFRLLGKELAADTFVEMSTDDQETLLNAFSDAELKSILDEMFLDDTVDIIEEMPANVVKRILHNSAKENRDIINELLKYPADSAGTIMTVEYVSLKAQWTVKQCFDRIRKVAVDKETIYTCYVTDEKRKLLGRITVKTLLLNDYDTVISNIMETNVVAVDTNMDKEDVANILSKYDLSALPVVDMEGRIVGIVTIDDALDVLEEEATEDISKMGAMLPSDEPYLSQSVWHIWKNRIPWLLVLLISATFTGLIINSYESQLNSLLGGTLLFACIPMLMDTGGNAGSQASITIIRSLALGDIKFKDAGKVIWKELRVSILLALVLGIVCFAKLLLIDNLIFGYNYTTTLSAIVSGSLVFTVVIAKLVGCLLPLIAKKCKLDPAVVASPFITTIVDILSLILYCNIAIALLPMA